MAFLRITAGWSLAEHRVLVVFFHDWVRIGWYAFGGQTKDTGQHGNRS